MPDSTESRIIAILRDELGCDAVSIDTSIVDDLSLNSLQLAELLMRLENAFDTPLTSSVLDFRVASTVAAIARALDRVLAAGPSEPTIAA